MKAEKCVFSCVDFRKQGLLIVCFFHQSVQKETEHYSVPRNTHLPRILAREAKNVRGTRNVEPSEVDSQLPLPTARKRDSDRFLKRELRWLAEFSVTLVEFEYVYCRKISRFVAMTGIARLVNISWTKRSQTELKVQHLEFVRIINCADRCTVPFGCQARWHKHYQVTNLV